VVAAEEEPGHGSRAGRDGEDRAPGTPKDALGCAAPDRIQSGVLTITLPKTPAAKGTTIPVKVE